MKLSGMNRCVACGVVLCLSASAVGARAATPVETAAARYPGAAEEIKRLNEKHPDLVKHLAGSHRAASKWLDWSIRSLPSYKKHVPWDKDLFLLALEFAERCRDRDAREQVSFLLSATGWSDKTVCDLFRNDPKLLDRYIKEFWGAPAYGNTGRLNVQFISRYRGTKHLFAEGLGASALPYVVKEIARLRRSLDGKTLWKWPMRGPNALRAAEWKPLGIPRFRAVHHLICLVELAGTAPNGADRTELLPLLASLAKDDRLIHPMVEAKMPVPGPDGRARRGANMVRHASHLSDPALYALYQLAGGTWAEKLDLIPVTNHIFWEGSVLSFGFANDEQRNKFRAAAEAWYAKQPKAVEDAPAERVAPEKGAGK